VSYKVFSKQASIKIDDTSPALQNVGNGTARKTSLETTAGNSVGRWMQTWRGSSFQTRAAVTGKARSPTVDNHVRRTISGDDDAERTQPRISRRDDIYITYLFGRRKFIVTPTTSVCGVLAYSEGRTGSCRDVGWSAEESPLRVRS